MTSFAPAATDRFDVIARGLHWTMAILIALAFVLGLTAEKMPETVEPLAVQVHVLLGASLVVLLGFRVLWRVVHAAPPPLPATPTMKRAAQLGHLALYVLMGGVLAAGLATLFLRGRGIEAVLFTVPSPFAENRALARSAKEVHEILSFALIGLTGLHVAAALWHQFVLRDHTLARMAAPR
ncbi:MAG: cytochrome b [Burkholderiales bacterium]|nr:cytochrome b [Burkholderiales bacterium]